MATPAEVTYYRGKIRNPLTGQPYDDSALAAVTSSRLADLAKAQGVAPYGMTADTATSTPLPAPAPPAPAPAVSTRNPWDTFPDNGSWQVRLWNSWPEGLRREVAALDSATINALTTLSQGEMTTLGQQLVANYTQRVQSGQTTAPPPTTTPTAPSIAANAPTTGLRMPTLPAQQTAIENFWKAVPPALQQQILALPGGQGLAAQMLDAVASGDINRFWALFPDPIRSQLAQQPAIMSAMQAMFVPGQAQAAQAALGTLGPSATGQEDIEAATRFALGGQRNVADLLLGSSARELVAQAEQSPQERAIRMAALGNVPSLLTPGQNVTDLMAAGQRYNTLARGIADPNAITAKPYADPMLPQIQSALLTQIQKLTEMANAGPGTYTDPERQQIADALNQTIAKYRETMTAGPRAYSDPIQAALGQEILKASAGDVASPTLQRKWQDEERVLRQALQNQLGPGYETSTPGIQALAEMRQRHTMEAEQYRQSVMTNLSPLEYQRRSLAEQMPTEQYLALLNAYGSNAQSLGGQEQSRQQFEQQFPLQRYQTLQQTYQNMLGTLAPEERARQQFEQQFPEQQLQNRQSIAQNWFNALSSGARSIAGFGEDTRRNTLSDSATLSSTLGRTPVGTLTTGLSSIASIPAITGLSDASAAARQQDLINAQAALDAYKADAANRAGTASSISGIFGLAGKML